MTWTCLLVDLSGQDRAAELASAIDALDFGMPASVCTDLPEAVRRIDTGNVLVVALFADSYSPPVQSILRAYQTNIGCIAEFQAVVCDEPDPTFMAGIFEFGIEQFVGSADAAAELAAISRQALQAIADTESPEAKTVALSRSIRRGDQGGIKKAQTDLGDLVSYDYRAAFARGKACEATGDVAGAVEAFGSARTMNKMFRPSATSLGETLLVAGRFDDALAVFRQLEKTNPYDVERKANIATVFVEKGDFAMAQRYVDAATKISPDNSRVLEAQAQVLLSTGKLAEAFALMDRMSEVGPFFAAKLNELGIQLSQAGKGKSALALYQKAHRIVRPELRYKISLNAALACRRLKAWDMALKFLTRCEREYGRSFPKLHKIREAIDQARAQECGEITEEAS